MNEDILKSQIQPQTPSSTPPTPLPEHPLDILHTQTDPYHRAAKDLPGQKPLRTYESDVAEILARQMTSVISAASAENERKLAEKAAREKLQAVRQEADKKEEIITSIKKTNRTRKIFLTLISTIFIIAGILGGYYFYLNSPVAPAPVAVETTPLRIPSLFEADQQKIIDMGILQPNRVEEIITNELRGSQIEPGKILEIVPMHQFGTSTIKLTGTQFIEALNLSTPDILKRSLTDKWMVGTYSAEGNNFPFIIFNSDFFQNTFAGMLKWESSMPEELADVLDFRNKAQVQDPNSTSTINTSLGINGSFTDKIIRNRDVREFTNSLGEILFLYTFIDQNTVVITVSEAVIPALVDRIDKQTYIR